MLAILDSTSRWWTPIQNALAIPIAHGTEQPYFAVAVAQPEPYLALIDISQSVEQRPVQSSQFRANLLSLTPDNSILVIEVDDFRSLHDQLLESQWLNTQLPGFQQMIGTFNQVFSVATTLDYRADLINQMTNNSLVFVAISEDSTGSYEWSAATDADNPAALQATFERVSTQLPVRSSLTIPLLRNLIPQVQFDVHVESIGDLRPLVIDLNGADQASDLLITTVDDGQILLVGNRYGIVNALDANNNDSSVFSRFEPYRLTNRSLGMAVSIEGFLNLLGLVSSSGIQTALEDRFSGIEAVLVDVIVAEAGISSARVLLLRDASLGP